MLVETVLLYGDCLLKTDPVMRNVLPLVVGCGPLMLYCQLADKIFCTQLVLKKKKLNNHIIIGNVIHMYSSKKLFFHKLNKESKSQTYLQYSTVPF